MILINMATIAAKPSFPPPPDPRRPVMLLSWMYKTHVASETQQFQESRPITLWCDGTACCVRRQREEVLPMEALYHLGAAPVLWLAGDQHSSWHPLSPSPGGSDLCLAPVALQGLSQPGQLALPLSPGHLPWFPPQAWFGAVKQGLLCLCLVSLDLPAKQGAITFMAEKNICLEHK